MTSRISAFALAVFLSALTACLLPAAARAADPAPAKVVDPMKMTVEQGQLVMIDVLTQSKARPNADVTEVSNDNSSAGKVQIAMDKKKISYVAANGASETHDVVKYKIRDADANADYVGQVDVTVTAPQRITTLDYGRVAGVLGIILVLATVLEIGLATIFNWKYFQDNFEGRGLRTPIAVGVSIFFVWYYKLDVISDLLSSFTDSAGSFGKTLPGYIITAFIVAGGSGTVNKLFAALGLRPPADKSGQLVIKLARQKIPADEKVNVSINGVIAGTIGPENRFPAGTGTYALSIGEHTITLSATDQNGASVEAQQKVTVAVGAEADITMVL